MDNQNIEHQNSLISSFIEEVELLRRRGNINWIDAVIGYCENNDVDIEAVGSLIKKNPKLRAAIEQEAEELNFLEKTSRLPI